ncbi:MAG TPA: hypothetical protein DIT01_05565 [Lentisphaeria bacterium]|nr:hypothetical protein [Lentisphaeria bacterium]
MLFANTQDIAGIPCTVYSDGQVAETPVLVFYHGWTGDKNHEDHAPTMAAAVAAGFVVVAPDCVEHGDRISGVHFRAVFNGWAFICEAMDRTRQEASRLLDAVLELPFCSSTRPQVGGVSMGGLIAQMVFAEEKRYATLTSIVGRSSFYQADEWCRRAQAGTWCDDWCAAFATQSHPERFVDRPVLFIDGGDDPDCRPEIDAETVRLINAAGGAAAHFVEAGYGHGISPVMTARFTAWLVQHRDG